MTEVNECTQKLRQVLQGSYSGIENNQDIVPIEINSDNSEHENDSNANKRTRSNSSYISTPMMETLGSLRTS